jgi:hypothetical protein
MKTHHSAALAIALTLSPSRLLSALSHFSISRARAAGLLGLATPFDANPFRLFIFAISSIGIGGLC